MAAGSAYADFGVPAIPFYVFYSMFGFQRVGDIIGDGLPASIAKWIPGDLTCLGTDGYGLSESRENLREYFGISGWQIARLVLDARGC